MDWDAIKELTKDGILLPWVPLDYKIGDSLKGTIGEREMTDEEFRAYLKARLGREEG